MTRFGSNLRAIRERAGLTQEALASRLSFKQQAPISIWETSDQVPSPKTVIKLAAALGCTTAELLAGVVTPYDRLRGSVEVVSPTEGELKLTDDEKRLVRLFRKIPEEHRPHQLVMVAAAARSLQRAARGLKPQPDVPRSQPRAVPRSANRKHPPGRKRH
jgi:transcriptional regulator with XRE-family HTH domain